MDDKPRGQGQEDMVGKTGLDSATYRVLSDASPTLCPTFHDALGAYRSTSGTSLIELLWSGRGRKPEEVSG